jgi:hypothetical protein
MSEGPTCADAVILACFIENAMREKEESASAVPSEPVAPLRFIPPPPLQQQKQHVKKHVSRV